jgi:hypothetical protein
MRFATLGLVALCAAARAMAAQPVAQPAPAYVDLNQPDPAPLKLDGLNGKVEGLGGDAMPRVAVSLFAEDDHHLLATTMSDREGKFHFDKVAHGLYRVVATVEGLCPANIPVRIESKLLHAKLVITMRPKDLDTCSYGMAKK